MKQIPLTQGKFTLTDDEKALADKYIPLVRSYAYKACYKFHRVPTRSLDDLTSFLLAELCYLAHHYDESRSTGTFMRFLIWNLRHRVTKFLRSSSFKLQVPTTLVDYDPPPTPAHTSTPVLRQTIVDLMNDSNLSPALQETMTLYYLQDKTQQQIGHSLNLTSQTVAARLHRARCKLQAYVARNHLKLSTFLLPPGLEDNTYDDHEVSEVEKEI